MNQGGKRHLRRLAAVALLVAVLGQGSPARADPPNMSNVVAEADFIFTMQLSDGAITLNLPRTDINPYFGNIAARGLARAYELTTMIGRPDIRYSGGVWQWLNWYQSHMEPATGFVHDYCVLLEHETPAETCPVGVGQAQRKPYDSTDSYAATFLSAADAIWRATHDRVNLNLIRTGIARAVHAIELSTLREDGLTYETPSVYVAALMDNVEVYEGLTAAADLADALGDPAMRTNVTTRAANIKAAIPEYRTATGRYSWALSDPGNVPSGFDSTQWYPSTTAEGWLASVPGLISASDADALMSNLDREQASWDNPNQTGTDAGGMGLHKWYPRIALGFLEAGRTRRAQTALDNFEQAALLQMRVYGLNAFHSGVAGSLILLAGDARMPGTFDIFALFRKLLAQRRLPRCLYWQPNLYCALPHFP